MDKRIIPVLVLLTLQLSPHNVEGIDSGMTIDIFEPTENTLEVKLGSSMLFKANFSHNATELANFIRWSAPSDAIGLQDTSGSEAHYRNEFFMTWDTQTWVTSLAVRNISLSDDGVYRCQLIKPEVYTGVSKTRKTLVVLVPPPKSEVKIVGGSVQNAVEDTPYNITCTVDRSRPAVQISWLLNGVDVPSGFITSNTTNPEETKLYKTTSVLSISPKFSNNGDVYTCKVSGRMMDSEYTVDTTLSVQYPPKLVMSIEPLAPSFIENTPLKVYCTADSLPTDVTWKWYMDEVVVPGETGPSYEISKLSHNENRKTVRCEATNAIGSSFKDHKLSVHYGPRFTVRPTHLQVDLNESATFPCAADGNPVPTIIWMKKGSPNILASNAELKFAIVREEDIGAYECIASVTSFENVRAEAYLLKKAVPSISTRPELQFSQGQTAAITCEATAIPKPTNIIWRRGRDGAVIDFGSEPRFSVITENTVTGVTSILNIEDLASNDFGEYNCTIVNVRGAANHIFKISQADDFPWMYVLIGIGALLGLAVIITVVVCCMRRSKDKSSSADSSPYWTDPDQCSNYNQDAMLLHHPYNVNYHSRLQRCSLSVVSNTTDNSIKKPADGMDHIEDGSLPEYAPRSIDTWNNTHQAYDSVDYPKLELYGTMSSHHATPYSTFNNRSQPQYGTYSSQQHRNRDSHMTPPPYPVPQYGYGSSPQPSDNFHRYGSGFDIFPDPPKENRLATDV